MKDVTTTRTGHAVAANLSHTGTCSVRRQHNHMCIVEDNNSKWCAAKKRTSTVRSYNEAASKSNVAFATVMTPVEGLMLKRRSLSPLVMRYVNTWPWQGQAWTPTNEGNENLERNTNRDEER